MPIKNGSIFLVMGALDYEGATIFYATVDKIGARDWCNRHREIVHLYDTVTIDEWEIPGAEHISREIVFDRAKWKKQNGRKNKRHG